MSDPASDEVTDPTAPRPGVRLGVDVGDVRIGVARCDRDAIIVTPVETVPRGRGDLARLVTLTREEGAVEVIVGLPVSLSGREGPAAAKVRAFAVQLQESLRASADESGTVDAPGAVPVRLVDERLTTVSAERVLRDQGTKGSKRRAVVDQAAAVVILQHAIDIERSTGRPPGHDVGQGRT